MAVVASKWWNRRGGVKNHFRESLNRKESLMGVYKQAGSKNWWYKFTWNGQPIRESTKQSNKRVAEQMEATHKASLARGEIGIREKEAAPTLAKFADEQFLPFVRSASAAKPNTVHFYENSVANLKGFSRISSLPIDRITSEVIASFVSHRHLDHVQISTINRDLATLRRMFHLATEWEKVSRVLPRVRLLPGENHRERVLSFAEEDAYLTAATDIGHSLQDAYDRALTGIRAVMRGQEPRLPDLYLLRDVVTILIDCALRPEECFRLRWENFRDGLIDIHKGKGKGSRRRIPASNRSSRFLGCEKFSPLKTGSFQLRPEAVTSSLRALKNSTRTP